MDDSLDDFQLWQPSGGGINRTKLSTRDRLGGFLYDLPFGVDHLRDAAWKDLYFSPRYADRAAGEEQFGAKICAVEKDQREAVTMPSKRPSLQISACRGPRYN